MPLGDILQELYEDLGFAESPAPKVKTRMIRRVNRAHEAVLSEPGLASLLNGTLTFDSVASRARYGLANVAEIRGITTATRDRRLIRRSEGWYRATNPDPASNEGTPAYFIPIGLVAVAQVPAATGTGLWVESSSASDTTQSAQVDTVRVNGYSHTPDSVTLTGTARVQIDSLTDYIDVKKFMLSDACLGDVSLYDAAVAGTLLAVIPRGQTTSRYFGFYLTQTPSGVETFTVFAECEIVPLVNDTDEPRVPLKFQRIVGMRARMREYEGKNDERYQMAALEYVAEMKKLQAHVNGGGDPLIPGGAVAGVSDLGGQYPAGTIWD